MKKAFLIVFMALTIISCSAGNKQSKDPTERGLSYVAGTILTSAVIRALFND